MYIPRTKVWREVGGLTQRELGQRAGVQKRTISRAENGSPIYPRTARKIADTLDVRIADLMLDPPVRTNANEDDSNEEGAGLWATQSG